MRCRHCHAEITLSLIDLGSAPPSNAYLTEESLAAPEQWFPLRVLVCEQCWLAQTEDYNGRESLFDEDYAYFSSFSTSWLAHANRYVEAMVERFGFSTVSTVVEVAANDGYLLQYFNARGIPCYGIEPTTSTAAAARSKGIEIIGDFFGVALADQLKTQGRQADLIVANNVLAHVPDINDFVQGFARLLKPAGVATFEFPHLLHLVSQNQFDTIYHEHYSYLSLLAVERLFRNNGLKVFDVEDLSTHGGSLRVYACNLKEVTYITTARVEEVLALERAAGMESSEFYRDLQATAVATKHALLEFLLDVRRNRMTVGAYGAAAKGNTLLNFAGIRPDLLPWVVDRNPAKQGKFLPGSRIPIVDEERIQLERPDYILILPWNLTHELMQQLEYVKGWGGKFVVAIPDLRVY